MIHPESSKEISLVEIMTREVQTNDLKEVVNKLIPDSNGKDIEKACQSIYPLHDVYVRKVKICPGPGSYRLPPTIGSVNHDYTRFASPAYSFHRRLGNSIHVKDSSPGPCYYVEPGLTRFGRTRGPSYSMLSRAKPRGFPQSPGPATYSPERVPPASERRAPSFSMGSRTKQRSVDLVPSPNSYTLPSLLGPHVLSKPSSPSFTLSGCNARGGYSQDLSQTPGPGCYNTTDPSVYLRRPPAYSILGRTKKAASPFGTPGPGAHSPEKVRVHKRRAPSYSLGVRHSEYLMPFIVDPPEW
ncbi:hypothetical protein JRQ81_009018 [Phrynocephalus forsythii]|uniref:Outer dense fiber protein 3-like protein 2 n=1 Tax=Phrynocephalus forsythii TaxID=171643 RepID=A0A9Q1AST9_9SAUR|nr:hypothetical protein JRQ81_009018 [Phrynocephalus forsythii]